MDKPVPDRATISPRARIAVLQAVFNGGGAEAVCAWTLQALVSRHDVTLITVVPIDPAELDRHYGTHLAASSLRIESPLPAFVARPVRHLLADASRLKAIRQHALARWFAPRARSFDLAISAYNEMDLGAPGLQYIHHPRSIRTPRWLRLLAPGAGDRIARNLTLANSQATARRLGATGIAARVLYPPVPGGFSPRPWAERQPGFVCAGRLVASKGIDRAIAVIAAVRARGFDVHLHVTGLGAGDAALAELCRDRPYVTLHRDLDRASYCALLSSQRYGLHMKHEAFGIAIAEMVRAGAVPFVIDPAVARHSIAAQGEVIADCPELLFASDDHAVLQICALLSLPLREADVRARLAARQDLYSEARFVRSMQTIVAEALASRRP